MRRILHIEEPSDDLYPFITCLHQATYASIIHAPTVAEGILKLVEAGGKVDLVIYTVGDGLAEPTAIPARIRSELERNFIRVPHILLLANASLSLSTLAQCRHLQLPCLLRTSQEEIDREVNLIFWMMAVAKYDVTFRIEYRNGNHSVYLCGPTQSEHLRLSRQLMRLLLRLASGRSGGYTTEELAEALGVCRQTIKKYMAELRKLFDAVGKLAGATCLGKDVFWTRRGPGGTLHGLSANVVWP